MRQVVNNPVCMGQVYVAGGRMQFIQFSYHLDGAMTSQCYYSHSIFLTVSCQTVIKPKGWDVGLKETSLWGFVHQYCLMNA